MYSKSLSKNCAGWIPIKLYKYKQYPYITKMKEIEKLMEKMNNSKNSGMKDPLKELPFLISHGLDYLCIN